MNSYSTINEKNSLYIYIILYGSESDCTANRKKIAKERKKYKIHLEKVSYLKQKLHLSLPKSSEFFALYNEQFTKLKNLHHKEKELHKKLHTMLDIKEKELEIINDKLVNFAIEKAKIKRAYYHKFKQILSPKEIVLLHRGEREFRRILLKKIRNKHTPPPVK